MILQFPDGVVTLSRRELPDGWRTHARLDGGDAVPTRFLKYGGAANRAADYASAADYFKFLTREVTSVQL